MLATHLDIIQISLGRKVYRLEEKHTHTHTHIHTYIHTHTHTHTHTCTHDSDTFPLPTTELLFSRVRLSVTPQTAAHQASLSFTISQNSLKLMSIDSVMQSNNLILIPSSSCLQSFPASRSFPISRLFTSVGQSIGTSASASVLPMNIQGWFLLGLTGLISFQSKRLSRVFSNNTVQKHQFLGAQSTLWSNSHIHVWLLEKP